MSRRIFDVHLRKFGARVRNSFVRYRAGLTLHGENICQEISNDLYQAHASIYRFFQRFTANARVLDLGSGTGYGSVVLAENAASVTGVDIDPNNIRYAQLHFQKENLNFVRGDAQSLADIMTGETFETVVSSNVFEHLSDVDAAMEGASTVLSPGGVFVLAVPPIYDEMTLRAHDHIHYHRSNLFIHEWLRKMRTHFCDIETYVHSPPPGAELDFTNPLPSKVDPLAFRFEACDTDHYPNRLTLTAIFVGRQKRSCATSPE